MSALRAVLRTAKVAALGVLTAKVARATEKAIEGGVRAWKVRREAKRARG